MIVSAARRSARMLSSRLRLNAMFRNTRPSSQSYQVAAVCGAPLGSTVAITARYGFTITASTCGGSGSSGTRVSPGPALEPAVRLPERHRDVIVRDVLACVLELGADVRDELVLRRAAADVVGPVV